MNPADNVFKGNASQLEGIDIDTLLSNAETPTCEYYIEPYGKGAREAEEKGEAQKAAVYRFLQIIVGFHPSFDTPSNPFVPRCQMDGKRSLIPSDLTPADIEVVRALAKQTKNPALRARLHDVLWELTNEQIMSVADGELGPEVRTGRLYGHVWQIRRSPSGWKILQGLQWAS